MRRIWGSSSRWCMKDEKRCQEAIKIMLVLESGYIRPSLFRRRLKQARVNLASLHFSLKT
jgi:hypothetical protein